MWAIEFMSSAWLLAITPHGRVSPGAAQESELGMNPGIATSYPVVPPILCIVKLISNVILLLVTRPILFLCHLTTVEASGYLYLDTSI